MAAIDSALTTVRSTLSGILGASGGPFPRSGSVRLGQLTIDSDAKLPGGTKLLAAGRHFDTLVQTAADEDEPAVRSLCIKVRDAYGAGRDQDFLLASSADGVPFHHLTLPAATDDDKRASVAPRQEWIPVPKAACRFGSREISNSSGLGNCSPS